MIENDQKAAIANDILPLLEKEAKERQFATLKQGNKPRVKANLPERENGRARDQAAKLVVVGLMVRARQFELKVSYIRAAQKMVLRAGIS